MSESGPADSADPTGTPGLDGPDLTDSEPTRRARSVPQPGPGHRLSRSSPFYVGFVGGLGVLLALGLARLVESSRSILVLILISLFLALGLNPLVRLLQRHRVPRGLAVSLVTVGLLATVAGFVAAIVPPLTEQTNRFVEAVPGYLEMLRNNQQIHHLDLEYKILENIQRFVQSGDLTRQLFGGIYGAGVFVASTLIDMLTVLVLTVYFLGSLPSIQRNLYRLVPRSRRARVQYLGDQVVTRIGRYLGGSFSVAVLAGTCAYLFLLALGVEYALPLGILVALLDPVPLIGMSIATVVVALVCFGQSVTVGVAALAFFMVYQPIENYVVVPRVMRASVDLPPPVTIVGALLGGTLAGLVGALLAIPVAAAVMLIIREVVLPRQERA